MTGNWEMKNQWCTRILTVGIPFAISVMLGSCLGVQAEERSEKLTLVPAQADRAVCQPVWQTKSVEQWADVLEAAIPEDGKKADAHSIPSIREQWYAAYALGEYGQEALSAVPVLLKRFAHEAGKDDDVRACILYSLGKMQAEEAFPVLCEALESDYPLIVRTAALALGRFPKPLASSEGEEAVKMMRSILRERSELQIPLAANCAVTLWATGKREAVCEWMVSALTSERKDAFTRNFELYQGISVCLMIAESTETEELRSFFEHWTADRADDRIPEHSLPGLLADLAARGEDADVKLLACETLAKLGSWALPAVREAMGEPESLKTLDGHLLSVWVQLSVDHSETQELLFRIVLDSNAPERVRISAVRGLRFLPDEQKKTAADLLVKLLNDAAVSDVLAMEARLMLDRLTKGSGT